MTHKVVQTILDQKFPGFMANDPFTNSPNKSVARPKPVHASPVPQYQQQQQEYIEHQGQPHIQQVQHVQQQVHPQQQHPQYQQHYPQQQQMNQQHGYIQQYPQQ